MFSVAFLCQTNQINGKFYYKQAVLGLLIMILKVA
jgi:hypothetical protein